MIIIINGKSFNFDDDSEVAIEALGYDLYIQESGFDKSTEECKEHFTSKIIILPPQIEARINRNSSVRPCSKIYEDSKGRKRLYTYFD